MAAKQKIKKIGKIEIIGGQAKPGPELASFGINMGPFIKEFNEKTSDRNGEVVPTIITAYEDRSFSFVLKTTPTARMILKFAKVKKGSANSLKEIVGSITADQVTEIAKYKQPDLNVNDLKAAEKQVIGTAKNMGIEIKG